MYEDAWYSFVPEVSSRSEESAGPKGGHRRKNTLLQQPNSEKGLAYIQQQPLENLYEDKPLLKGPPPATLARRAKSYTDFYHVARAHITKETKQIRHEERRAFQAPRNDNTSEQTYNSYNAYDDQLVEASLEDFQLYRDQLALSERHLDNLLDDTNGALDLLQKLGDSFKEVEEETAAFQARCEDLLEEQRHLRHLVEEVGTDLQYYTQLEPITRRLNAPGASNMLGDDSLVEIMSSLDACIEFMRTHPEHKESETYLARYQALLTRTLSLLQLVFTNSVRSKTSEARATLNKATKLNTTTLYLIQDPDTHPTGHRLQRSIEHIVYMSRPVFDPAIKHIPRPGHDAPSVYYNFYRQLIEEYVGARRTLIGDALGQILSGTIAEDYDAKADFGRYARACLNTTLEVCMNEYLKYALFFTATAENKSAAMADFYRIWKTQQSLNAYTEGLCTQAFKVLEPSIQRAETATAAQLALWIDNYVSSADADIDGSAYGSTYSQDGLFELKAHLAGQLKNLTTQVIFARIKDILYAQVSRFFPKPEDLRPREPTHEELANGNKSPVLSGTAEAITDADMDRRAHEALGDGFSNAYAPLKTGIHLLILNNDLSFDSATGNGMGEMAYEIIHETSLSIMRASSEISRTDTIDAHIFAIKNLVLLKNLILAYEISGSRQAAALDFTRMWTTFTELRTRGGLFDVRQYYRLITAGELLPEVVNNVLDARVELDGLLRETITKFREECAGMIWRKHGFPPKREAEATKAIIKHKLEIMFTTEEELRDNLWEAVEVTLRSRKK